MGITNFTGMMHLEVMIVEEHAVRSWCRLLRALSTGQNRILKPTGQVSASHDDKSSLLCPRASAYGHVGPGCGSSLEICATSVTP